MALVLSACRFRETGEVAPARLLERPDELALVTGSLAGDFAGRREAPVGKSRDNTVSAAMFDLATADETDEAEAFDRYDRRAAIVARPGARLSWHHPIAGPASLRVSVAPILEAGEEFLGEGAATAQDGRLARFEISTIDRSQRRRLLADPSLDLAVADGWLDLDLPLPREGVERIELAVDSSSSALGAFANPEIVPARPTKPMRPNLILISLDTLRADHLGSYGYTERPTSPYLDRLAGRSVRFETAVSQAPWTRPSHRAMLTGVYPASRGALERVSLATDLWNAGYRTAALTAGGQVDAEFGFDAGFERFKVDESWLRAPDFALADVAKERDRPFFLFLHTYEVHDPYEDRRFVGPGECPDLPGSFSFREYRAAKRQPGRAMRRCIRTLYDGDIAFTDERIGRLFDLLRQRGELDRTIVVVTSDHGEQLFEHDGWQHGLWLYEHQLHVPLIVRLPESLRRRFERDTPGRRRGSVVESPVALVDLAPSLLELVGVELGRRVHGRSFVPLLRGEIPPAREILSESTRDPAIELKSLRGDRYKFIRAFRRIEGKAPLREFLLFDLRRDPDERHDLAGSRPEAIRELAARLEAVTSGALGELEEAAPPESERRLLRRLRALGYLDEKRASPQ